MRKEKDLILIVEKVRNSIKEDIEEIEKQAKKQRDIEIENAMKRQERIKNEMIEDIEKYKHYEKITKKRIKELEGFIRIQKFLLKTFANIGEVIVEGDMENPESITIKQYMEDKEWKKI